MNEHPLKTFQRAYGLSADQLAKKFGRTEPTMYSWFKGRGSPTMNDFKALEKNYSKSVVMELIYKWLKHLEVERDGVS